MKPSIQCSLETIWRFFGFLYTQLISTNYFQLLNLKLTVHKLIVCLRPLYPDVQNSPFKQARTPHRTTNSTPRKTSPIADRFLVDHRKRVCRRRVTQRGIPLPYWRPCGRQSLELRALLCVWSLLIQGPGTVSERVWYKESCEEPRSPQQEKYARLGTALATGAWLELCVSPRSALDISCHFLKLTLMSWRGRITF